MDPLSVMASVVGLLAAAEQVASSLSKVRSRINDAPRSMDHTISDVKAVEIYLSAIHKFLLGLSTAPRKRFNLIQVDQLLATLTEAVLTFSELETLAKAITTGPESSVMERVKWSWKEDKVTTITSRLERHKSSLSLMLNIVQCESDLDAEKFRDTLQSLVTQLLGSNEEISRRLRNLEDRHESESILTNCFRNGSNLDVVEDTIDNTDVIRNKSIISGVSSSSFNSFSNLAFHHTFEIDLNTSRPYKRTQCYESDVSFTSSNVRTHAWSIFSGLSLSQVSAVSAMALPLYAHEIPNNEWYSFGEIGLTDPMAKAHYLSPPTATRGTIASSTALPSILEKARFKRTPAIPPVQHAAIIDRASKLPLFKVVVLGDENTEKTGKTALSHQFTINHIAKYGRTAETPCRNRVIIDGKTCMLDVLDTAGLEEFTAMLDFYIQDSDGFVIVYSITDRISFIRARKLYNQIQVVRGTELARAGIWSSKSVKIDDPTIPIMLVGRNCEQVLEREVSTQEGYQLAQELRCDFLEASAKECINVEKAFYDVVRIVRLRRVMAAMQRVETRSLQKVDGKPERRRLRF